MYAIRSYYDAISQHTVAYLIIDRKHEDLQTRFNQYKIMAFVIIALLALLFYLLYRANLQRNAVITSYSIHYTKLYDRPMISGFIPLFFLVMFSMESRME